MAAENYVEIGNRLPYRKKSFQSLFGNFPCWDGTQSGLGFWGWKSRAIHRGLNFALALFWTPKGPAFGNTRIFNRDWKVQARIEILDRDWILSIAGPRGYTEFWISPQMFEGSFIVCFLGTNLKFPNAVVRITAGRRKKQMSAKLSGPISRDIAILSRRYPISRDTFSGRWAAPENTTPWHLVSHRCICAMPHWQLIAW